MKTATTTTRKKKKSRPESIINNAPKLFEMFEPGSVSHQGDLIIVAIPSLPKSSKPRKNRQLAEGESQGSRHILERGEVFDADPQETAALIAKATGCLVEAKYIGPVFRSPSNPTAHDLSHPEHGAQGFPSGSLCAIVYQRNLDQDLREQRVVD
jgi:hypothetical protein